jgi:excisionase family DNA binding protein
VRPNGFEPLTYGSGASNVRLVGSSKRWQGVESVRVGTEGRVHASQGLARFSSPFAAPVLQGSTVERWLTVGEVAKRLGLSTATVYALCKQGQLRHVRVTTPFVLPSRLSATSWRIARRWLDVTLRRSPYWRPLLDRLPAPSLATAAERLLEEANP